MARQRVMRYGKLNTEQKRRMVEAAGAAHPVLIEARDRLGYSSLIVMRDAWKKNRRCLDGAPEAAEHLAILEGFEGQILSGYGALAEKLAADFAFDFGRRIRADYNDFYQEACLAVYDALYLHNGTTAFSTYITIGIRRRFSRFIRHRMTAKWSFPESLDNVQATFLPQHESAPDFLALGLAKEALEQANLTDVERKVLMDMITVSGQQPPDRREIKDLICQKTQRKYTRQRLSQIRKEARQKVAEAYHRLAQSKAA